MEKAERGSQFTFFNFKVTDGNRYAYETALMFANNKGSNSVCLIGRPGSGKTHLLYAVRNYIKISEPELYVVVIDTSELSSELVGLIKDGKIDDFKRKYIDCDVLLIDDVPCCSGKESLYNELSQIFKERSKSEKRTMITTSENFTDFSERILYKCCFHELAVIRRAVDVPYSNELVDDDTYLILNDMTHIHTVARRLLKGNCAVLQTNIKKTIRSDHTELFRHLVNPDKPELIVLASRPGMGKTSLVLNLAFEFARKYRKEVDYFSWGGFKEHLTLSLLSKEALVDIKRLRDNKLETDDVERLLYCAERFSKIPLYIDDNFHNSGNIVFEKIKCRKNPGLIVIDYLELFNHRYNKAEMRTNYIKEKYRCNTIIIKELKKLVNELKVPILLLCHLARDVDCNNDKRPVLNNISWKFDNDEVDKIIFLYRDSYYNRNSKIPNVMELIIAKNNNDELETIEYQSDSPLKSFYSVSRCERIYTYPYNVYDNFKEHE